MEIFQQNEHLLLQLYIVHVKIMSVNPRDFVPIQIAVSPATLVIILSPVDYGLHINIASVQLHGRFYPRQESPKIAPVM